MSLHFRLLTTAAVVAFCASPALAAMKSDDGKHSFSGGVKATFSVDHNIAAAPASPAGGATTDDDDEEFDLEEALDSGELDEILEDLDIDTEDLAEDDVGDDDGDGIIDLIDEADSDGDGEDEISVGGARGKGKKDNDERIQTSLALKHGYALAPQSGISWKSGLMFGVNRQNDRQDLNRRNWGVNTGPEFAFKSIGVTVSPSVTFLDLDVNNAGQMQSTIGSLGANWKINKSVALLARYNREFRNNEKPRATDLEVDALTLGGKYVYGKNLFSAAYMPKMENNDNGVKDKEKEGFQLGYARKLPWKMQADLGFKYGETDFSNLAAPGRKDDDYQYTAKLTKNFSNKLFFDVGASHKEKDSNINKKDSNGQSFFVSTGWKF